MAQEQRLEKQKRILIVGQHFWPESFRINDIADYLVEQNYEVDVLCGLPNYPTGEFFPGYGYFGKRHETHNGIRIDRVLEIKRGNNSNLRIFLNYISYPFFSLFHLPKLCFRKYDYIFIYQLSPVMMAITGILLGKIKRIPTAMYVLDLWPENLFSVINVKNLVLRRVLTYVSRWHYQNVDKIIALSYAMKARLTEIRMKAEDSITVLPQAAEKLYETHIEDQELQERFGSTFNIVFTGNISPAQSFPTMIDAATILRDEGFTCIRWIIVGDGMSRTDIEREVKDKGLGQYFIFEGQKPVEDIPKYTNIADVLVGCLVKSPLLEATIPAKVMSYIASGRPIVLAMDGEVKELINSTIKCGFVSEAENSTELATNIKRIYNISAEEKAEMGIKAQEYHFKHLERGLLLEQMKNFIFGVSKV